MVLALGMLAGALSLISLKIVLDIATWAYVSRRDRALQHQLIRREQRRAEAQAQAIMQNTVQRMFEAARQQR